jgi:hypothetical protein
MMTQEPVDRREHVQVSATPAGVREQRIVHDPAAEERIILQRVTQFFWLVAALVEVLILMRVFLKLLAANPASPFAALVYGVSDLFLFPFQGLTATPSIEGSVLEIPSLIAMVVYFFLFWVLVRLVWLIFERPTARSVTTYDAYEPVAPEQPVIVREQLPVVERQVVYEQPVQVMREQPVVEEHIVVEEPVVRKTVVRREPHINDPLE